MDILALDRIISKVQRTYSPEEIAYLVRHLGEPYYSDGVVQLGHRQTADAQQVADGDLVAKAAGYPEQHRCQTCGYIGCRDHREVAA